MRNLYKFERARAKRSDPALNPYIYLLFFKRTIHELYELVVIFFFFTKPLTLKEKKNVNISGYKTKIHNE